MAEKNRQRMLEERMKIMERIYKSTNGIIEKTRYFVGDRATPRGKRKKGNTSFRKQEQNFRSATRRLARIFNCNYTHEGGMLIGLDFDDDGLSKIRSAARKKAKQEADLMDALRDEAEKEGKLFWRRLKRKLGKDIKVVLVTSDLNGDTGEVARIHCHMVLQAGSVSWDVIRALWTNGSVDIKQLRQQADYSDLAAYLMRQVRHQPDKKKHAASRNMLQPVTEERQIAIMSEIRTPPGAQVFERRYEEGEPSQYVRYLPKKRRKKIGGHKEGFGGDDGGAV